MQDRSVDDRAGSAALIDGPTLIECVAGAQRAARQRSASFPAGRHQFAIERAPSEQPLVDVDLDPVGASSVHP